MSILPTVEMVAVPSASARTFPPGPGKDTPAGHRLLIQHPSSPPLRRPERFSSTSRLNSQNGTNEPHRLLVGSLRCTKPSTRSKTIRPLQREAPWQQMGCWWRFTPVCRHAATGSSNVSREDAVKCTAPMLAMRPTVVDAITCEVQGVRYDHVRRCLAATTFANSPGVEWGASAQRPDFVDDPGDLPPSQGGIPAGLRAGRIDHVSFPGNLVAPATGPGVPHGP